MFWITHQSGRIIFNPVLIALGWRLYDIKYTHEGSERPLTGLALSRSGIQPGQTRRFAQLQDVLIVKE